MSDFCTCDEFAMDDREDSFGFLSTDAPFPIPVDLGGTGGSSIFEAQNNLGILADANSDVLWDVGALSSSTGAVSSSTTRLRTKSYISKGTQRISVANGYRYILFAYNAGTYIGTWNGSSFTKSGNWRTTETDLTALPDYDYRIVLARNPDSGAMTTELAVNLTLLAKTANAPIPGMAADAADVWDLFKSAYALTAADYRTTTLANGTDLNDVTTPGNYRTLSAAGAASLLNCPVSVAFRLTVSWVYGSQTTYQEIRTASGATYYRSLNSGSWSSWRILSFRLYPTTDSTENRTSAILSLLNSNKICELPQGTFTVEGLNMPADSTIRGSGRGTIIKLPEASTSYAVKMAKGCTIENVKIVGTGGEGWIPDVEANSSDGILINVEGDGEEGRNRMNISNVEVCGFTGAGIKLASTGVNYDNTVNIVNAYIHNNNYGIDDPKNSEYNRIANCSIARNVVGIRMNGGNNLVTNCGINGNTTGILMDTTGISGANNNSHGTFCACNINHSHTFEDSTATTAVKIVGMQSGEVFTGCQIAYGGIEIQNSIGINFNACNFLSSTPITVSGSGFSIFSSCVFQQTSASPVTKTGTGVLLFRECYVRTGAAFNPI